MKTINTNKPFLKLLTISGALSALLLSGCGGGGGGSTQSTLPNEGKAVNSLGYYGDGVYFGSKPILGTWQVDKEYRTFKSDGTVSIDHFGGGKITGLAYGVSANTTELIIDFSPVVYKIEKVTLVTEANCSDVILFEDYNDSLGYTDSNISTQYCKKNPSATLEPISNAGKATNAYGYYGEGVKFGNDLIVGNWGTVRIGQYDGERMVLNTNGLLSWIKSSDFGGTIILSATYGISEDGKTLNSNSSDIPFLEIIGLFEGCYLTKDQQNIEYKLCKMEDNSTSWVAR